MTTIRAIADFDLDLFNFAQAKSALLDLDLYSCVTAKRNPQRVYVKHALIWLYYERLEKDGKKLGFSNDRQTAMWMKEGAPFNITTYD